VEMVLELGLLVKVDIVLVEPVEKLAPVIQAT